jgi:small subunit ribosomal protein S20
MANTESAKKRTRQNAKRRLSNRYKLVAARNVVKELLAITDPTKALESYTHVESMIDRLAKHNIIHPNKAARQKSRLRLHVNKLAK